MEIRKNLHRILKKTTFQKGFTLIELIVVIAIIGILLVSLITTFNPLAQYNKANDARREHDLGQIQRALDSYFNDTGCYPTSLTFGSKWSSGQQVYMEEVPQDPDCASDINKCYLYETDTGNSCPQWNVLYSTLKSVAVPATACPLIGRTTCVPSNYSDSSYKYCVVSGNIDCSVISAFVIPIVTPTIVINTPTPKPQGTPTPTPALFCPGGYYGCTGDNRCNSISPETQCSQNGGSVFCHCDQHCDQSCTYN